MHATRYVPLIFSNARCCWELYVLGSTNNRGSGHGSDGSVAAPVCLLLVRVEYTENSCLNTLNRSANNHDVDLNITVWENNKKQVVYKEVDTFPQQLYSILNHNHRLSPPPFSQSNTYFCPCSFLFKAEILTLSPSTASNHPINSLSATHRRKKCTCNRWNNPVSKPKISK